MSTTLINYDVVVKELSKGLVSLNSEEAKSVNFLPHTQLSEFRTIRYGAGRQRGVTTHAVEMASKFRGDILYLVHNPALREEVLRRYHAKASGNGMLTLLSGYLPENWTPNKFGLIIVDEAGFFFNKYSYDKIFRSLADVTTEDVVIHLIN